MNDTRTALLSEIEQLRASNRKLEEALAQTTTALEECRNKYRALFEQTNVGVFLIDFEGRYLDVNCTAAKMLGYTVEELIAHGLLEIVVKSELDNAFNVLRLLLDGEKVPIYERTFRKKDGSFIPVEINATLVSNAQGQPLYVQSIVQDISKRKQSEAMFTHERDLLVTLIETIPDSIYYKDTQGRFLLINSAQAKILGVTDKNEAIGKTDFNFFEPQHSQIAWEDEQKILREGTPMLDRLEHFKDASGQEIVMSATKVPLRDASGAICGIVGVSRNITERQRVEESVQRKEAELRLILDTLPVMIWYKDTNNTILSCNLAAAEAVGRRVDEMVNIPTHLLYPDQAEAFFVIDQQVIETGKPVMGRLYELAKANGETYWVKNDKIPIMDENGVVTGILVLDSDITELIKSQQALSQSELRYRSLFENALEGIFRTTVDGRFLDVNPALVRILGYDSAEEVLKLKLPDDLYVHPQQRQQILDRYDPVGVVNDLELTWLKKDGSHIQISLYAHVIRDAEGQVLYYEGLVRDITERKRAQEKILQQNRRLLALQAASTEINASLSTRRVLDTAVYEIAMIMGVQVCSISEWNQEEDYVQEVARYTPEGYLTEEQEAPRYYLKDYPQTRLMLNEGIIVQNTLSSPDQDPHEAAYMRQNQFKTAVMLPMIVRGQVIGVIELEDTRFEYVFNEEEITVLQLLANQTSSALENARLYDKAQQEIAERKRSEEKFRQLMETVEAGVMIYQDGKVVYANPAAEHITGWQQEQLAGENLWHMVHQEFHKRFRQRIEERLNTFSEPSHHEFKIMTPQGQERWLYVTAANIEYDGKPAVLGTALDITERKHAQEQRLELAVEKERVKLLSAFVRDASHDFRTPLSTINTSIYLLRRLVDPERVQRQLDVLQQQSDHLERLVDGLFTMSRLDSSGHLELNKLSLYEILHDLLTKMQTPITQKGLDLIVDFEKDVPMILADRVEIHRALMCILENAVQYTHQGVIRARLMIQDKHAVIEIKDDGVGIDSADLPHIFERFYRADKARSTQTGGLGLGLSIAKKIVEAHNGKIEVESEIGSGSTFRTLLPINQTPRE